MGVGWGLLQTIVALTGLATVVGFLGDVWWVFEMLGHFRLQYAWVLTVAAVACALGHQWMAMVAATAGAAVNIWMMRPFYTARPEVPDGVRVRVVLANVFKFNRRFERVRQFLRQEQPDVIVVQEVTEAWLLALKPLHAEYPYTKAVARPDGFGIMVLSRWPMDQAHVVRIGPINVPSIIATIRLQGRALTVIATHPFAPISATRACLRSRHMLDLIECVLRQPKPVMVVADLNTTSWSPLFQRLLRKAGLRDSRVGFGVQTSWPVSLPAPLRIPIDHCLVSPDIVIRGRRIGPSLGSDHYPVILDGVLPSAAPAGATR